MNAATVPLEVEVDATIRSDAALAEAVHAASEYFRNDLADLPYMEDVVGAKLTWRREAPPSKGDPSMEVVLEEDYQDRKSLSVRRSILVRYILDQWAREMEMRALFRSVTSSRLDIIAEQRRRLIEQLYEEEEMEYAR
jgi:hypothetical protein